MITVEKRICGNPPSLAVIKRYFCDQCGTEGYPDGLREHKIFRLEETGEELCFNCLFDVLTMSTISEIE